MVVCPKCGNKNPNNSKFCKKCGNALIPQNVIFSNTKEKPNKDNKFKNILSIIIICCVGIIILGVIGGMLSPDENTDYEANNYSDNFSDYNTSSINEDLNVSTNTESEQTDNYEANSYSGQSYVGSVNSNKFHEPGCSATNRIKSAFFCNLKEKKRSFVVVQQIE